MAECEPENSEPLKYKTWVLKVSIHCEGCKRKVKRILHSIEGVYTIDVDARQHKVVVTGNVDANTLIRKLEKSGKHAELWPDFYQKNSKKNDEQFHQDQQPPQPQQQQPNPNQNQNQNPNIEKQKVAFRVEESQKVAENSGQLQQQQQPQVKEVRFEGNIPATGESQNPPGNAGGNPGGGGGAKKKKKKKKGHGGNSTNNNGNGGNGEVASMEHGGNGGQQSSESHPPHNPPPQNPNTGPSPNPVPGPGPEYMSPPQYPNTNRVYEYPPAYYAPPPVNSVSYNTAYPSSSYSASYYSAPPPYSYAYVHHGGEMEPPPPLDWNPRAVPPSDSFEIFSDENPNACSVM